MDAETEGGFLKEQQQQLEDLGNNTKDNNTNETAALAPPPSLPRESLITTAVNFLQNSKVRHTSLMQKQQFLKSKGLTVEEIQIACERAGVFTQDPNKTPSSTVINMGISSQTHSQLALQTPHAQLSAFGRIREILHSVAVLSGLAYAFYAMWKKYIEPFLFGKKKRKSIEEAMDDLDKKLDSRVNEVNRDLQQAKETIMQQQREQFQQINREFNNFRSDLEVIKGLLLNRKQFASPLAGPSRGGPSIPAWQMAAASASASPALHHHHHHHLDQDDHDKPDDLGSGSGSSETEVVTKNSDSSLEIM